MGFAKFNPCGPCCDYKCHPWTCANIVNPVDGGPSNVAVDLYASPFVSSGGEIFYEYDDDGNLIDTQINNFTPGPTMYPTGLPLNGFAVNYTERSGCPVPFIIFHCPQNLDYQDEDLIDLLACFTATEPFNKLRDLSGSGLFDRAVYYPGFYIIPSGNPIIPQGCPCYEVVNNKSSAWDSVSFTLYPTDFRPTSTGVITDPTFYVSCAQTYTRCIADLCNGATGACSNSGDPTGDHFCVDLPYCLTKFHANVPSTIQDFSNPFFGPYKYSYDGCKCVGGPGTTFCTLLDSPFINRCFYVGDSSDQIWGGFPQMAQSGCNLFSVPHGNITNITVSWPNTLIGSELYDPDCSAVETPALLKPCYCYSSTTVYGCNTFHVNMCDITEIGRAEALKTITGLTSCQGCNIADNCQICDQAPTMTSYIAPRPIRVNANFSYPNSTIAWGGVLQLCTPFGGTSTYWPNPINCCTALTTELQRQESQINVTYQGYEPAFCTSDIGGGDHVTFFTSCSTNEVNYAFIYMVGLADCNTTDPGYLMNYGGFVRFPIGDPRNLSSECCSADGSPLGTFTSEGADCHVPDFGVPTVCYRGATTIGLFTDINCCELAGQWAGGGGFGISFAQYCDLNGRPDCIHDGDPLLINGRNTICSGDFCNENFACVTIDADGNIIESLSI